MDQSPKVQSTDDDEEELQRDWAERLATGRPILTYEFDLPLTLKLDRTGQIELDCPCLHLSGLKPAGIVRVRLTPAAAKGLRDMVAELDKNPLQLIFGALGQVNH